MYCDYIVYLSSKKISSVTIHDYARDLKVLFKFLYKNKYIKKDIAYQIEKLPKQKIRIPKIISAETIKGILILANETNAIHIRNCLMIVLCYDCGLRLSELIRLQVNDFDKFNQVIRVTGKWNKQRNVPLTFTVLKYYQIYLRLSGNRKKDNYFYQ